MSKNFANEKQPANEIRITRPAEGKTDRETIAWALVNTPVQAAITTNTYLKEPFNGCWNELTKELQRQVNTVNKGDMRNVEGLLIAQAYTLDAIFHRLARRAEGVQSLHQYEIDLKLALRAQAQCARTLETLSTIKNPPNVAFVKQANIAHNQQVNNVPQADQSPASQPPVIDQLEHTHGNYLDTGTATAASGNDSAMAPVGKGDRPEDTSG